MVAVRHSLFLRRLLLDRLRDRSATDQWTFVDPDDDTSNERYWPYAAMDYYIQLDSAPDISSFNENSFSEVKSGATCTPLGSDILSYFRDRDLLVRTLGFLVNAYESAAYEFHGMMCAIPTIYHEAVDYSSKQTESYAAIDAEETCMYIADADANAGEQTRTTLQEHHLIGESSNTAYSDIVGETKYVWLELFEAHLIGKDDIGDDVIDYCYTFSSVTNDDMGISVRVTNDADSRVSENPCHSSNVAADSCYSTSVDSTNGLLKWTAGDTEHDYFTVSAPAESKPNLVSPYRRQLSFQVIRNDGWSETTLNIERELVVLRDKVRGESTTKNSRYVSDTKFYTTAPIRGLVYTVVHDPPGGDSYATISLGTNVNMELELATTRAATLSDDDFCAGASINPSIAVEKGVSVGTGYLMGELEFTADGRQPSVLGVGVSIGGSKEEVGPEVTVSLSGDDGWDFSMTLGRNLMSSQDPGMPGRPGDVILGGGFEIVYVRTDTLDLNDTSCLTIIELITWLPREPTSYFVDVFTIEDKIIPELEDLKETLGDASTIAEDNDLAPSPPPSPPPGSFSANDAVDGELTGPGLDIKAIWIERLNTAITDWTNTLAWASPDFNPELEDGDNRDEKYSAAQDSYEKYGKPLTDSSDGLFASSVLNGPIEEFKEAVTALDQTFLDDFTVVQKTWEDINKDFTKQETVWNENGEGRYSRSTIRVARTLG